ncbi:hypothetical protein E1B28_012141 [Marasmius oreades]|uniref:Short-chain dehydrogenase/reductase SDR n=1 Tax=Marasmius oreades TaxID=181124 RepID=A0A9P7RRV8_9AGAR|nr:uncharacterized protein E1B28_012141 [Marasmius oreades]KAG7088116.1 hypothetical protein E1B28_012141 [Marasmius oreades]
MPAAIFVIGAGPQIANAVATLFVKQAGFSVGLSSRSATNLERYKSLLPEGTKVATAVADANDPASCVRALEHLKSTLGPPSAILYNASSLSLGKKPILEYKPEDMEKHLRTSAVSGFTVLQWGVNNVVKDEEGRSALLVTGGGLSFQPRDGLSGLAAGKASLLNICKAFRVECPQIHVATVIVKGFVDKGDPYYASSVIAEEYWKLYAQKEDEWVFEVVH